jgi:hypothetical protein
MDPTVAQVMNALRAEEDLDERVAEELPQASTWSAKRKSVISSGNKNADNSGKGGAGNRKGQRGRCRYKAKAKNQDSKSSGDGKRKNDGCWKCGGLTAPTRSRVKTRRCRSSVLAWRPSGSRTRNVVTLE